MIKSKINVYDSLKASGYTTTRIRREKLLGESALQALRTNNEIRGMETLDRICTMLGLQPGDILEHREA